MQCIPILDQILFMIEIVARGDGRGRDGEMEIVKDTWNESSRGQFEVVLNESFNAFQDGTGEREVHGSGARVERSRGDVDALPHHKHFYKDPLTTNCIDVT